MKSENEQFGQFLGGKMKIKYWICGLMLVSLSTNAFSDELAERICGELIGYPRTVCLELEHKKAISSLNMALSKAQLKIRKLEYMPEIERKKYIEVLKKSQKLWQAYVKTQCNDIVEYEYFGASSGSGIGNAMTSCEVSKTLQRIGEIPVFTD